MAQTRTRRTPAEPPPASPNDLHGGKDGQLWQTALQLAGGDPHRIRLDSNGAVTVVNQPQ